MKDKNNISGGKSGNWYDTMLNGMASAFGKFVAAFKKHGLLFSTFVMVLFVLCYTLIINPVRLDRIIEQRMETEYMKQVKAEAESKQRRLKADQIVGDIMTKMIDKFPEIHRCLVLEAHNSLRSLQMVDFLYYSCSFEMLTPNSRHFNYLSDDLQRQMRSNLIGQNMINTLKHREYLVYDDIKECHHPDHRLIHKLADAGDSQCIIVPFLNNEDDPVILLIVSGDELPVDDIIEYISTFKKQIEQCLM